MGVGVGREVGVENSMGGEGEAGKERVAVDDVLPPPPPPPPTPTAVPVTKAEDVRARAKEGVEEGVIAVEPLPPPSPPATPLLPLGGVVPEENCEGVEVGVVVKV